MSYIPITFEEEDGTPSVKPRVVKVPNGALTDNGDGSVSLASGTDNHSALSNLSVDDHTQYALLAGRSGGQTVYGGSGDSENLTLESTAGGTKGVVQVATGGVPRVGLGATNTNSWVKLFQSGVGNDCLIQNTDVQANAVGLQFTPADGTNVNMSFQIVPKGTGLPGNAAQFTIFNTDYIASPSAYEYLAIRAQGTSYAFIVGASGASYRPLYFYNGGALRFSLGTNGSVGIGGANANSNASLDIQLAKPMIMPKLTTAQKNAVTATSGMVVYDTTLNKLSVYTGAAWETVTSA